MGRGYRLWRSPAPWQILADMKRLLAVATLAAVLAIPASASAVIVPQRGIAGVALNQTKQKVRAVAGAPVRIVRGTNEFGQYTVFRYRGLTVNFQGNRQVTAVSTGSRAQRTASGVGVGSTEAQLTAAIPAVTCESFGEFRSCTLGVLEPGRRVTDFRIKNGKVNRVVVSFVID